MEKGSGSLGGLKTSGALTALLLFSSVASAQSLELLGPSGLVSPDGFLVAVIHRDAGGAVGPVDDAKLTALGAQLRPAPSGPDLKAFLVLPEQGAKEVVVRAVHGGEKTARTFTLGPPAARVSLRLEGAPPVKGRDPSATLLVTLQGGGGEGAQADVPEPVLRANVGEIKDLRRLGPTRFRATYVLPETLYPEVAVIAAFAPWPHPTAIHGAVGSLLVPLASSIDLPGRVERNASMSIEIAGERFGPVTAGPDGRFSLPVIVPPGHRYAKGIAIDRAGNRKTMRVDLRLPPTDQLACVANPRRLPANGVARARIICATTDVFGKPERSARIELSVDAGRRSERRTIGDGLYEWIYTAPAKLRAEPVEIKARWRDRRTVSKDDLTLTLVQGAAEKLEVTGPDPVVHYGGVGRLSAKVMDALGRPRDGAVLQVEVPAGEVTTKADGAGFEATWTLPPNGETGPGQVRVRAFGPMGTEPARLGAFRVGDTLHVGLTDESGWPIAGQTLSVDGEERVTGADGSAPLGTLGPGAHQVRHAAWPGLSLTLHVLPGGKVWPLGVRPGTKARQRKVTLAPPLPVNVRIRVQGRQVAYWVEDPKGKLLPGREVSVSVDGAPKGKVREADGKRILTLRGKAKAQVSVSDLQTGVTAVAEVPP